MVSHWFTPFFLLMTCVEVFSGSVEDSLSASFAWSSCAWKWFGRSETSLKNHFCWPLESLRLLSHSTVLLQQKYSKLKGYRCILMFENDLSVSLRDSRSQKPWNMDRKSARVQKQTLKGHTKTLHSFTVVSVVGKSFWNWNLNRNTNTDGCTFDYPPWTLWRGTSSSHIISCRIFPVICWS